jgi:hypothetical protein
MPLHIFDEPPLPSLIASWTPIALGAWKDNLLPLFSPLLLVSLLTVFFSSLKRYFTTAYAAFFTFLLAGLPLLLFHAGTAYADFLQAVYYSISTLYLFRFFKEFQHSEKRGYPYLLTSLIFLGISVWVKKSGIYHAGINLSVLAVFAVWQREELPKKALFYALLLFTAIVLPWLAYEKLPILSNVVGEAIPSLQSTITSPNPFTQDINRAVISAMFRSMFLEGNWQLLWALFFAVLALYPGKALRPPHIYLAAIVLLQLAVLFVIYRFTGAFPNLLDDTQFNRFMMHFVPVVLYFCAEVIAGGEKEGPSRKLNLEV